MFIITAKVRKGRIVAVAAAAAVLCGVLVAAAGLPLTTAMSGEASARSRGGKLNAAAPMESAAAA